MPPKKAAGHAPKDIMTDEATLRRVGQAAAKEVAGWPEWRKHPTQVSRAERDKVRNAPPAPPEPGIFERPDHEEILRRVGQRATDEVASWPEWRRNPTQVPRSERHKP